MDEHIDKKKDDQIGEIEDSSQLDEEIQDTKDRIEDDETQDIEDINKPENDPTHSLEASPPSPPSPKFECPFEGCGKTFASESEHISHMDKESADAREKQQPQ